MNRLKKILVLLLIAVFVSLGAAGCNGKNEHPSKEHPSKQAPPKEHPSTEHPK